MIEEACAQAVGSAVVPIVEAAKGIYKFLKLKYDYVKILDKNFYNLRKEEESLCNWEADVKQIIATNEGRKEKTHECTSWLCKVERIKGEINELSTRKETVKKCFCGLCPFRPRLKLGRDIVKKTQEVVALKDEMKFENILIEREPMPVEKKHAKKKGGISVLYEKAKEVLGHLKDKEIKKIGILGMEGIGKTTILKILNDKIQEENCMFDFVIWVDVTKEASVSKIQQIIVERLKLNVEGINTEQQVAARISEALETKRYLLLLDEVFSEISLNNVGIHDSHNHGKWVLACRRPHVCTLMDTDEEVRVEIWPREDAWILFQETVGEVINLQHIKPIAELVLKQCGGHPQMIRAVAKTLRHQHNQRLWENKLRQLQAPSLETLKHMEEAFKAFKLCYDELGDDRQQCLLYGALFPDDHEIYQDYLMECWKAQQFIRNVQSFREARGEGHDILKDLIEAFLLESCRSNEYIKMPMIFRRVALRIRNPPEALLVKAGEELEKYDQMEEWERAEMISLMCNNLQSLPDTPRCPTISTLFLQKNKNLKTVPESFFNVMSRLQVLDLHDTRIESLPGSISNLINLRGLYLNDCQSLVELPPQIERLKNLEILDVRGIGIRSLPVRIGELASLRCLRVSFVNGVGNQNHVEAHPKEMMIPPDVLSRLHCLEELTIDVEPDEPGWNQIVDVITGEVASLTMLNTLSFYFPSIPCLRTFIENSISWKDNGLLSSFISFKFLVGSHETRHPHKIHTSDPSVFRHLRFSAGESIPTEIAAVLERTFAFELIGHGTVQNLSDFGIDRMNSLEVCVLEECSEMQRILSGNMIAIDAFQDLQKLHIFNLQRLNCIWEGSIGRGSLAKLNTLTLSGCPNIMRILSGGMTQQLPKLQHLRVEDCSQIANIIEANEEIIQFDALPKLKILELVSLPNLVSIYENDSLEWSSLQTIEIRECRGLRNLSLSTNNAKELEVIKCNEVWWRELELEDNRVKEHLQRYCRFI